MEGVSCVFEMDNISLEDAHITSDDDCDVCSSSDIQSLFNVPYHLVSETAVAMHKVYILHTCVSIGSTPKVAVGLSDYTCSVYDAEHLTKLHTLRGHSGALANVRFSPQNENLLYTGSVEGIIKLWDLRTQVKLSKEFKDDTDGCEKLKPIISFDVAFSDRFLSAGTELVESDAFLLFWDIRSSKLLGGYWESHTSDITEVCFHPKTQNTVATGSTDGLINVFDISKGCEDDALWYSLNTESSVERLGWFLSDDDGDTLSCITSTEILQLWKLDGAAPYAKFERNDVTESLQRKCSDDCYLVNVHQLNSSQDVMLVAGSTGGQGDCLRTLQIQKDILQPRSVLVGNKQIVRDSWYDENSEILITGGESGLLNVWKPGPAENDTNNSTIQLKINSKARHKRKENPY